MTLGSSSTSDYPRDTFLEPPAAESATLTVHDTQHNFHQARYYNKLSCCCDSRLYWVPRIRYSCRPLARIAMVSTSVYLITVSNWSQLFVLWLKIYSTAKVSEEMNGKSPSWNMTVQLTTPHWPCTDSECHSTLRHRLTGAKTTVSWQYRSCCVHQCDRLKHMVITKY